MTSDYFSVIIYKSLFISISADGEERTIEFMEQQTVITQSTPLLEGTCSYGVVEHPFPMNCFLKDWSLGPEFYHSVKIGIVQYVCVVIKSRDYIVYDVYLCFK